MYKRQLDYLTEYRVRITDDAMSVDSVRLDGDEDGEPGGDYEFKKILLKNFNMYKI